MANPAAPGAPNDLVSDTGEMLVEQTTDHRTAGEAKDALARLGALPGYLFGYIKNGVGQRKVEWWLPRGDVIH